MNFKNAQTKEELLEQLKRQTENPYARLDENNPWAKIACTILKCKKSVGLEKLLEKIENYKINMKLNERMKEEHKMKEDHQK